MLNDADNDSEVEIDSDVETDSDTETDSEVDANSEVEIDSDVDMHGVLVEGAIAPNFIGLDPHWGTSWRFKMRAYRPACRWFSAAVYG